MMAYTAIFYAAFSEHSCKKVPNSNTFLSSIIMTKVWPNVFWQPHFNHGELGSNHRMDLPLKRTRRKQMCLLSQWKTLE
jgi:hypothetical protein